MHRRSISLQSCGAYQRVHHPFSAYTSTVSCMMCTNAWTLCIATALRKANQRPISARSREFRSTRVRPRGVQIRIVISSYIDLSISYAGRDHVPTAGRPVPSAPAARAGPGSLQRERADRHSGPRPIRRLAPSRICSRTPGSSPRIARPDSSTTACPTKPATDSRCGRSSTRSSRPPLTTRRCSKTRRACRRCCAFARRTSTPGAIAGGSCPAGAGRPGRARWASCCRRSTSWTSAAVKGISRSKRPAGHDMSRASTDRTRCSSGPRRWRFAGRSPTSSGARAI